MKKSVKVEDIITVQEQIDRVQTNLDRLEGRLRVLNNRIDLSTITVSLKEPAPIGGVSGHSIIDTIKTGIAGFFGMIEWLIIAFLTLLPLIILGGRRLRDLPVAPVEEDRAESLPGSRNSRRSENGDRHRVPAVICWAASAPVENAAWRL